MTALAHWGLLPPCEVASLMYNPFFYRVSGFVSLPCFSSLKPIREGSGRGWDVWILECAEVLLGLIPERDLWTSEPGGD